MFRRRTIKYQAGYALPIVGWRKRLSPDKVVTAMVTIYLAGCGGVTLSPNTQSIDVPHNVDDETSPRNGDQDTLISDLTKEMEEAAQ